jgi:chromosome segregation ATPase
MTSEDIQIRSLRSQLQQSDSLLRSAILQRDANYQRAKQLEQRLQEHQLNPQAVLGDSELRGSLAEARTQITVLQTSEKFLQSKVDALQAELDTLQRSNAQEVWNQTEIKTALSKALAGWEKDKLLLQMTEEALQKVKKQRDEGKVTIASLTRDLQSLQEQGLHLVTEGEQKKIEILQGHFDSARQRIKDLEKQLTTAQDEIRALRVSNERIGAAFAPYMQREEALNTRLAEAQVKIRSLEVQLASKSSKNAPNSPEESVSPSTPPIESEGLENDQVVEDTTPSVLAPGSRYRHINGKRREIWIVEQLKGDEVLVSIEGKPNSSQWRPLTMLQKLTQL